MAAAIPVVVKAVGVAMSAKAVYDGLKEGNLLQAAVGAVGGYYGVTNFGSSVATQTAADAGTKAIEQGTSAATMEAGANQATKVVEGVTGMSGSEAMKQAAQDSVAAFKGEGADALSSVTEQATKGAAVDTATNTANQGGLLGQAAEDASNAAAGAHVPQAPAPSGAPAPGGNTPTAAPQAPEQNPFGRDFTAEANDTVNQANRTVRDMNAPPPEEGGLLSRAMDWAEENPNLTSTGLQLGGMAAQGIASYRDRKEREEEMERSKRRRGNFGSSYNNGYAARRRG